MRGPATTTIRRSGRAAGQREGVDHPPQQVFADARAADGDDADLLVRAVAELGAQRLPVGERRRVEACHVAGEVEVLLGPVADHRKLGTERSGTMSSGLPTKIARSRTRGIARDVLDHLGVVVGRQERLALAAVGHRQPADEVGEPGVRGPLELRVLVQVVVELPCLVADPEVVVRVGTTSWKTMKLAIRISSIRRQAWKQWRSCSADSDSMWPTRWPARRSAGWTRSPSGLEDRRDGVLCEPVDLEVGIELAQLAAIATSRGMAEADRRGDVEGALGSGFARGSSAREVGAAPLKSRRSEVDLDRVADMRGVAGALEREQPGAERLGEREPPSVGDGRPRCRG